MGEIDVTNVGAAGTFVVRGQVSAGSLREEFVRRLPFSADVMICQADEIVELAAREPFGRVPHGEETGQFVSVMAKAPLAHPRLPIEQPSGENWQVKIVEVRGRYALSLRRRTGEGALYPNEIVERSLNTRATTRGWNTITSICKILNGA